MDRHEARWYENAGNDTLRCLLCPRACLIRPGRAGFCGVRENCNGVLTARTWGHPAVVACDPIEKKPLYHFYPGTRTLSLGGLGCNLQCLHCQNHDLSAFARQDLERLEELDPGAIPDLAKARNCRSLTWTYNEPVVWGEYILDSGAAARDAGLATAIVTAGLINQEPLREILAVCDAFRLDIKGFDREVYRRLTGFDCLDTVLASAVQAREAGCHLEIVTNVIDGWNDATGTMQGLAKWIVSNLGPETPWHVTASRPAHRLQDIKATPAATIHRIISIGREAGLHYVYGGNLASDPDTETRCPRCSSLLISRRGFSVIANRIDGSGSCPDCGSSLKGIITDMPD